MHIAIDDTYSSEKALSSKYVTGDRRTHVAVAFPDSQISHVRAEMRDCLDYIQREHGVQAGEFHFVDIYNRNGPWKHLTDMKNLGVFEAFASIYHHYQWNVHIQTIDDRTLDDHDITRIVGTVDGLDLSKRSDLSLFFLLSKIKHHYPLNLHGRLTLIVDNRGDGERGTPFGQRIFADRGPFFKGSFESSAEEPLLQIADFIAFCINRSTHLSLKPNRTDTDYAFLELVANMEIKSPDIRRVQLDEDFSIAQIDEVHRLDRVEKGLE